MRMVSQLVSVQMESLNQVGQTSLPSPVHEYATR